MVQEQIPVLAVHRPTGEAQGRSVSPCQHFNRISSYCCCLQVDRQTGSSSRDLEEVIEVQRFSIADLRQLMVSGDMLLPSVATCFMALDRLKELDLLEK